MIEDDINKTEEQVAREKLRFYETWTFLILFCICVPILIRSFLYTPFHIPSGSMKPTLLVGDYIFVSKFSYGYSKYSFPLAPNIFSGRIFYEEPKRGDIIVFRLPTDTKIDYIKRLVGLPGDRIQVRGGKLIINGDILKTEKIEDFKDDEMSEAGRLITRYIETLPEGKKHQILDDNPRGGLDETPVFTVPEGHFFFMGDNRDNSQDSRVMSSVGFVPAENLIGRAEVVFVSMSDSIWRFWAWFSSIRTERFFMPLGDK